MTKQNKNWEERLIKEYREQDFECEEEKEIFWLDKLKTLMIDTLEEAKMKEKSKKKVRIWHPFSEVIIGDIVFVGGFNSAVEEINQRIEEIKKRYE